MLGSTVLDVLIGLALVYFFLSLVSTVVTEFIANIFKMRSKNLEEGIRSILGDPAGKGIAKQFYEHPIIYNLSLDANKPSYIPARSFAMALMDIIAPADPQKGSQTIDELRTAVNKMPEEQASLKKSLLVLVNNAQGDLNVARANVEKMFDDAMDRVTGWYKRKSQKIIFCVAIIVTIAANADTLNIGATLYRDQAMRTKLVTVAEHTVQQSGGNADVHTEKAAEATIVSIKSELDKMHFPLGWKDVPASQDLKASPWARILGWLLTTIAVSLGAPFWFDTLNKFVNMRAAGVKPKVDKAGEAAGFFKGVANATQALGRGALLTAVTIGGVAGVSGTVMLKDANLSLKPGTELGINQKDLQQLQQGVTLNVRDDAFKNVEVALKPGAEIKLREEDARLLQQGIALKMPTVSLKETTVSLDPKAEVRINKDDLNQLKLIVAKTDNTPASKLETIDNDLKNIVRELKNMDPRGNISPR